MYLGQESIYNNRNVFSVRQTKAKELLFSYAEGDSVGEQVYL